MPEHAPYGTTHAVARWLMIAACFPAALCAGQTATAPSAGAKVDIPALVRKLGDNDYKTRQDAQEQLRRLGSAARAALEKAATDDDSEVRQRATDLLKELAVVETQTQAQAMRKNLLWTFELVRGPAGPPAIADGKVVFLGSDSKLHALDAAKGKELWNLGTFTIKVGECDTPVLADGTVFLTDRVDSVYAIDLAKGQLLWRQNGMNRLGLPCVEKGFVYLQANDEAMVMLARTGEVKAKEPSPFSTVRPVWAGGIFYRLDSVKSTRSASAPEHVQGIVAIQGKDKRLWEFDPEAECSHLFLSGDALYFKAAAIVGALEAKTGKKLWDFGLPALVREEGLFAVVDGTVYATCYNKLVALEAKTGQKKWQADFSPTQANVPKGSEVREMMGLAIDGSGVYVGRPDGLHALDLTTGKEVWTLRTANRLNVGPTVADGVLYFGTCLQANPETNEKPDFEDSPGLHALKIKGSTK